MSASTGQGRPCSICHHPQRVEIDRSLVSGEPLSQISKSFDIGSQALRRHYHAHLPASRPTKATVERARAAEELAAAEADRAKAVAARTEAEVARSEDLVVRARQLQGKAIALLQKAEAAGDLKTALAGVREAARCVELQARMMGDITDNHVTNVFVSQQWITVQSVVLQALEQHPAARDAVIRALETMH